MKHKKWFIGILSCLFTVLFASACNSIQSYPESDKVWGDGYEVNNLPNVTVDEEITLDGELDEIFWGESQALYYESKGEDIAKKGELYQNFQDGSISIKTYFGDIGVYFGIEVKDPVIYKTNQTSNAWKETNLEFYIATAEDKDINQTEQVWFGPDGSCSFGVWLSNAFRMSTARNLGVAAKVDGEGIGKANNVGYTVEGILSWEDLGLSEKPEYIRVYPCMIRVMEIPYSDGSQQQLWQNFAESMGASYGVPKTWLKFTSNGYAPRRQQEDISTYDASAFATYPEKTITEYNGDRSVTYKAYYEKGVGLWVNGIANHDTYGNTGDFSKCSNFEVQIEGKQAYIYASAGTIWTVGFDEDKSMMWTKENASGAPTEYTSYLIGFISDEALLEIGVTQSQLDRGWLQFLGAFKTSGENATFNEGAEPVAPDWWRTPVYPVGEEGYFVTKGETQTVQFTDTTTKKSFTYSASLNEYGLYFEAEVRTDSVDADSLIRVEFTSALGAAPLEQYYGVYPIGHSATYKLVSRTTVTEANKPACGYNYRITYNVFLSYAELKNLGVTYGYNEQSPIDSTIYINAVFKAGASDSMEFQYVKADGTIGTRTSGDTYGWGVADEFGWAFADNIANIRQAVTKNGIQ